MAKPYIHACNSVKKYGGRVEDYLPLHELMDSSKAVVADNRHRALSHNTWFITTILDKIFGPFIKNSDGVDVPTRDLGEQHCVEDLGNVPSAQDYLNHMEIQPWMSKDGNNVPPFDAKELFEKVRKLPRNDGEMKFD